MFAYRKLNVKQWEELKSDDDHTVRIARDGESVDVHLDGSPRLEQQVMYWRKANHIHRWFVENVQGGKDDCEEYKVSIEHLQKLNDVCTQVIAKSKLDKMRIVNTSVSHELLPTMEGFFFGSTEYGEDYFVETVRTHFWAAQMIMDNENGVPGDIYYRSSW